MMLLFPRLKCTARNPSQYAAQFSTVAQIKRVGVCGAGLMGHGIAQAAMESGYQVVLCDTNQAALDKGVKAIQQSLSKIAEKQVKKGALDQAAAQAQVAATMARLHVQTTEVKTLAQSDCQIIIEAIIENTAIKNKYYQSLGELSPKQTIFASNTSSFSITELGVASNRPDRMIGLHFFNPVQLMNLVEVISTPATSAEVTKTCTDFIVSLKKTPVACGDTPGFIVNRLLVPFLAEAMAMVDRGDAKVENIDTAMKLGAGMPMGPLYLADYIGLDTCLSILKGWQGKVPGIFVPRVLEKLVSEGKLGRKSGEGFYGKDVWGKK